MIMKGFEKNLSILALSFFFLTKHFKDKSNLISEYRLIMEKLIENFTCGVCHSSNYFHYRTFLKMLPREVYL